VGNLSVKRDFTDVRDVVRAYSLLIQKGTVGETYNVGSGKAIAIDEILTLILSYSKVKITIEVDPDKLRPVDVPIIEADISKLKNNIGWKKQIEIENTIQENLLYWRELL
jgi:GDP-4-dehydro-6-deoxy-D-mannose reductase